ncbi:hypothetical protein [Ilumatobacter sp.]|uniref:hypothetical protein n=1 Tax=Ilumatobacter sp. TaxID=1967498 RepID=UPI003750BDDD
MGLFDKVKNKFAKAKDSTDDLVEANSDKIPDDIENKDDKVSDAAEKVIPGDDKPGE